MALLYHRRWRLIFNYALRIVRDFETAEEVAQDVFHQVWRSSREFDATRGTLIAWMMRIAFSRTLDRVRRDRRMRLTGELCDDVPASEPNPEGLYFLHLQRRDIQRAMTLIPPQQQALLQMAFYDGYSHSEIARLSGIPLGTVKTRVRRGLALTARSLAA